MLTFKIRIIAIFSLAVFILPTFVFAGDVTIPGGEELTISIGGQDYTIQAGSTATSVAVGDGTFTITTGSGDNVSISSSTGKKMDNDSGLVATCIGTSGVSKLSVGANKTVVFSPSGATECLNIPNSGGGSGGGGSGASGGGQTSQNQEVQEPESMKFKDVTKSNEGIIMPLVNLMLANKTYKMPINKIYGVRSVAKGLFLTQVLMTVAGENCGSVSTFQGARYCRSAAIKAKIISSTFPIGNVTRVKYYEALLKAKKIPLKTNVTVAGLKKVCIDAKGSTLQMAKVYMTAKQAGIAGVYPGKKCRLSMAFSKTEAAKFAMRAVNAK